MFRITRGINIQHAPAFSPIFRFSGGTPPPIHHDGAPADLQEPADAAESSASAKAPADPPS